MAVTFSIHVPPLEMAWGTVIIWASLWKRYSSCTMNWEKGAQFTEQLEHLDCSPQTYTRHSLSLALESTFSAYISQHNNSLYFYFCLCNWERIENHRISHDNYLYVSIKNGKVLIVRNAAKMPILAFTAENIHLPYLFVCGLPVIFLPPSDSKLY